jgi:catechol 2,3-dioxygenase-like lactoylglutathione lyase family enzyme
MLDHTEITVTEFNRSKDFYEQALAPLSIVLLMEVTADQPGSGAHAGFGTEGKPFFWIDDGGCLAGPVHIAFGIARRS